MHMSFENIDGGSEFSEWFFRTAGRVYGHAVNLHQAMQEAATSPHFLNRCCGVLAFVF